MNHKIFALMTMSSVLALSAVQADQPTSPPSSTKLAPQPQAPSSPKDETVFIPKEADQTDIYAIPLDEDAFDQQEELDHLEHPHSSTKNNP